MVQQRRDNEYEKEEAADVMCSNGDGEQEKEDAAVGQWPGGEGGGGSGMTVSKAKRQQRYSDSE